MGLKTRKNEPFATVTKSSAIQGDNIVFIKGGSTALNDTWIQFGDLRIDVKALVDDWVESRARRLFNKKGGILFVLIALTSDNELQVVPSISLNQTVTGNVTTFEDLSGKLPLLLVKLTQDGSNDLSSFIPLTDNDIEIYKGYGNFTLRGTEGFSGPDGDTGQNGLIGETGAPGTAGDTGSCGETGAMGITGPPGPVGDTGADGVEIPTHLVTRVADPQAEFVGSPLSGNTVLDVQFTNLSTGTWESLFWDFGDGTGSTEENPSHSYPNEGLYTITLTLVGVDWVDTETKYDYVNCFGSCAIQNVVDSGTPEGSWQGSVDDTLDTFQSIVEECPS